VSFAASQNFDFLQDEVWAVLDYSSFGINVRSPSTYCSADYTRAYTLSTARFAYITYALFILLKLKIFSCVKIHLYPIRKEEITQRLDKMGTRKMHAIVTIAEQVKTSAT
jgi:hypothetical protein